MEQKIILGIDEVGRGAWAGPLVVGAVILGDEVSPNLADSKKLAKIQRESLAAEIKTSCVVAETGWANHEEVDELGLTKATSLAINRALQKVKVYFDEIIIDGRVNFLPKNLKAKCVVGADGTVPAVSAASIIAKVERDDYMRQQAAVHKLYGFESHVGYGTKAHIEAIEKLGICPIHRRSYKPLARFA